VRLLLVSEMVGEGVLCLTKAFGGDRDDGVEARYCAEVDRV